MEPALPGAEALSVEEGEVILTSLPQAEGQLKTRPGIALRVMPSFGDILVCGISTQLHQQVAGFDEVIASSDADFVASGLRFDALIRLDFLTALASPHQASETNNSLLFNGSGA